MTNAKEALSSTSPKAVDIITVHGISLVVIEHEGQKYVPLKPLSDFAGIDWKGAKRTIFSPENVELYESVTLTPPQLEGYGGPRSPQRSMAYIRLDRVHWFLARISVGQMRGQGNISGAAALVTLHKEWASALYDYETKGVAINHRKRADVSTLLSLIKACHAATDPGQRSSINALVNELLADLGHPVVDPQGSIDFSARAN